MPAISVNIITKDQPWPTITAIESLKSLLKPGDEIVISDTGSSERNLQVLFTALNDVPDEIDVKILEGNESVELTPYVEKWLPAFVGKLETDEQYKDLRGILNFAKARQVALDASKNPVIFWIDSDDVLVEEEPGALREAVDEIFDPENPKGGSLFLDYQYAFADDGQLTTILKRERFVFKDEYVWKGRCHETLCPVDGIPQKEVRYVPKLKSHIQHTEARKASQISDIRNYIILRNEIDETVGQKIDPRTIFYLANAARGLSLFPESVELYKKFDCLSGSQDDRFAAAQYIAAIYMHPDIKRPVDALDYYQKCMDIKPRDPRGYFGASRCYLAMHRHQDSITYFNIGREMPEPVETLHSYDPTHVHFQPYLVAAEAAKELGQPAEAVQCARRALQYRPDLKEAQEFCNRIEQWAASHELTDAIVFVGQHLRGGPFNAKRIIRQMLGDLHVVPYQLEKMGVGKPEAKDPREPAPKIGIYCGPTLEMWGPNSGKTGIGGSEKMAIILAPELQKLGYNVTVYAEVPYPERGVHPDGVRWQHWSEADYDQDLEALIAWRGQAHLLQPFSAKKRILWLHDIQFPERYNAEVKATLDAVICQSKFHAEPLRGTLSEDQILVGRNAIKVPELLRGKVANGDRDPNKIIYMSCPSRGLTTAIKMYAAAKEKNPQLSMTVLYGITPFFRKVHAQNDHGPIPDLGRDASMMDYERYIGQLCDLYGVRLLNRVGFDDVWKELLSAGIWLYPTRFPEISCMAAMEAQAAGLVCVTSQYAALAETLLPVAKDLGTNLGPVEDTQGYIDAGAIAILKAAAVDVKDPRRLASCDAACDAFNVEDLAKCWAFWIGGLEYDGKEAATDLSVTEEDGGQPEDRSKDSEAAFVAGSIPRPEPDCT
jgi:tetratricopeptide (TPR) repeat protein